MTEAIIYTRFSPRPNAKECDSCKRQDERCLDYCDKKGYRIRGSFKDEGVSGGTLIRPGLQGALDVLEAGTVLLVDSLSRLSRDLGISLAIEEQVEQAGATIEYADGTPCDNSPEGKLQRRILVCFAAFERDRIRLNTKRGIARNRAAGKKINGRIPTGMREDPKNPGMLMKCPRERQGILLACRLKRDGFRRDRDEIARLLNCYYSVGPYRGHPWSGRLIDKVIVRHSYWADPYDGDLKKEPEFF